MTFRLHGSLPKEVIEKWRLEFCEAKDKDVESEIRKRIEKWLDNGKGPTWLACPKIAEIVEETLLINDEERYWLHGWVVMPNHVHVLLTPKPDILLSKIMQSWKSFTGRKANEILGRSGAFWQAEYFERFIRNRKHFAQVINYIDKNPVKAGLCEQPEDWRIGSARRRLLNE